MIPGYRMLSHLLREVRRYGAATRAATGKGIARQIAEILRLRFRGFSPADYYLLALHSSDTDGYVGTLRYARLVRYLNPKQVGVVPFNKWVMSTFLYGAGLPVPGNHGVLHPSWGWRRAAGPLRTVHDLRELLTGIAGGTIFKPLDGGKGKGIRLITGFDVDDDAVALPSGDTQSLAQLWDDLASDADGYLVQEQLHGCRTLQQVHPKSLNTVRVTTLIGDDGVIRHQLALFRSGASGAVVDNMSAGGLACKVDLDSGRCGKLVMEHGDECYSCHPDTGIQVEGLQVPFWADILDLTIRAHGVIPFPRVLSWDVAVTDEGPLFVEVNGHDPVAAFQKAGWRLLDGPLGQIEGA